jgi:ribonuclease D
MTQFSEARFSGYARTVSKDDLNALPLFYYAGDVVLVRDEVGFDKAMTRIRKEKLLGLDTESKPSFQKGKTNDPALVQIACSDIVFLFQLIWLPLDERLTTLLEDASCLKAGVAINDDMKLLAGVCPFTAAGLVDLGETAEAQGLHTKGLRTLAANFLGVRISKSAQCSNWSRKELSPQQVRYAATDAWVSRKLYQCMCDLGFFDASSDAGKGSIRP